MGRIERMKLISTIEEERDSKLLVYITGDRRGLETKIANDALPFCVGHLSRFGDAKNIDLFLYSTGGMTLAGYSLVNTIREFCSRFCVIVPYKALSAATLIALGADEIIMTKMGELSPIDPSVMSPLAPQVPIPGQPGVTQPVPVNVEDVVSYIKFAQDELHIKDEESLVRVFERLVQGVHPLTLGAVSRTREQIGFLAKSLLSTHMKDPEKIGAIVEIMTRGRYSHDYVFGRKEAKEIVGLPIVDTSRATDENIVLLYQEYDKLLELSTPYHPESYLKDKDIVSGNFVRAVIESKDLTHIFRTSREIKRIPLGPPVVPTPTVAYQEMTKAENWVETDSI